MLVNGTPGSRRRLAVDDDGLVVRTGSKKHAKLGVCPTDLPDRTGVPGQGIELVVLGVPDNLEYVDLAVARCGGELLTIVVQLRVVDVAAVMRVYRLQGSGSHPRSHTLQRGLCSSAQYSHRDGEKRNARKEESEKIHDVCPRPDVHREL